jgi:hypothetical protein
MGQPTRKPRAAESEFRIVRTTLEDNSAVFDVVYQSTHNANMGRVTFHCSDEPAAYALAAQLNGRWQSAQIVGVSIDA